MQIVSFLLYTIVFLVHFHSTVKVLVLSIPCDSLKALSCIVLMCCWIVQVEPVIDKIMEKARTGEIGDGKIFCKCSWWPLLVLNHAGCWVGLIQVPFSGLVNLKCFYMFL